MKLKLSNLLWLLIMLAGLAVGSPAGMALDGAEILAKVDERGQFGTGGRITIAEFAITATDGSLLEKKLAFFTKTNLEDQPDRLLAYFLEPELERGAIFLSIDPVDSQEISRLFIYLPALGEVRELVSERDRNTGFAGSNIQQDSVGRSNYTDDYIAELVGEDLILGRQTYVLKLTARPGADVDYPTDMMWVDQQEFIVLRQNGIRAGGVIEQVYDVSDLQPFEGRLEANKLVIKNVLDNSETEITTLEKRIFELPDEIFDPENLPGFDPSQFGVE